MQFRNEKLTFKITDESEELWDRSKTASNTYKAMSIKLGETFELNVEPGSFSNSEIVVMLGENGTGKTTFIKMLAGALKPQKVEGHEVTDEDEPIPKISVS